MKTFVLVVLAIVISTQLGFKAVDKFQEQAAIVQKVEAYSAKLDEAVEGK